MKKTVFLIDDELDTRSALGWLIESWGFQVQTYSNGESFLAHVQPEQIGCLILDVLMPHITGFALQKVLQERYLDLPIIFISGHGDIPMALHAMKVGSVDFLTKPIDKQLLLEAINQAIKQHVNLRFEQQQRNALIALIKQLTPRETDVLKLMIEGKLSKVIAKTLNISLHTAELHRARVMKKMQVKTLAELVNLIVKYHINEAVK